MYYLITPKRCIKALVYYGGFAILVLLIAPLFGSESLHLNTVLFPVTENDQISEAIFWKIRVPRVILAFLVGASLAVVGGVMQVVLRNALATPYTLGVTGGSTVGACLAITLPAILGNSDMLSMHFGIFSMVQAFALVGSFTVLLFIYLLARRAPSSSNNTILLAGVSIGVLCTAITLLLGYLASPNDLMAMYRWMIGGLSVMGYNQIVSILPLLIPGMALLFYIIPSLNHLALGQEMAQGHGVDVAKIHIIAFIGGGMVAASVVSVSGPIGFIGLVIPHIVRRLSGFDHRIIIPASLLLGGTFLVLCDTIARTVLAPTEMPVGVVTAILGAPFFIHLLLKQTKL